MSGKPKYEKPKYEKRCVQCGELFLTCYVVSRFCSRVCQGAAVKKSDIPCKHCGKPFHKRSDEQYCSPECGALASRKEKLNKICAQCEKEFTVPQSYYYQVCCGKECGTLYRAERRRNPATTVCQGCGEAFQHRRGESRVYCSRNCSLGTSWDYRQKSPRVTLVCRVCGKPYEVLESVADSRKHCSNSCRMASLRAHNQLGEELTDSWRGHNWKTQSAKVRKRDKSTCQHCKRVKTDRYDYYDVHHIIPYRVFNGDYKKANELSNLVLLCRSCHGKADSAYKRTERK